MAEIEEIKLVPAKDVLTAEYWRYRQKGGSLREFAKLFTEKDYYIIERKQLSQLFRYLNLKLSEIRGIGDWQLRDSIFKSAVKNCDKELVLSVAGNRVIRIVSSDFTAIPHSKVLQCVEKVLKLDYEDRKVEYDGGMFAKWTLKSLPKECVKLGEIVSWQLWTYNHNVGNKSLRIGGGFTVLKCNNGATGWKLAHKVRLVHRGDYEDLLSKITEAVHGIVYVHLPVIAHQIQDSMEVPYPTDPVWKLIQFYPQWIRDELERQLRQAHTVWDVSNAFSYVATHCPVTWNQRVKLSNHAVEVLQLAGR